MKQSDRAISKTSLIGPQKLNIELPYDPAVSLLGYNTKRIEKYAHTKTDTQMFLAFLFIIAKKRIKKEAIKMPINWYGMLIQWNIQQKIKKDMKFSYTW